MTMDVIAHIRTDLPEKFGVPRQSGLVPQLRGTVVFEPAYRNPDALRGLEGFSHLWLIFWFHRAISFTRAVISALTSSSTISFARLMTESF